MNLRINECMNECMNECITWVGIPRHKGGFDPLIGRDHSQSGTASSPPHKATTSDTLFIQLTQYYTILHAFQGGVVILILVVNLCLDCRPLTISNQGCSSSRCSTSSGG